MILKTFGTCSCGNSGRLIKKKNGLTICEECNKKHVLVEKCSCGEIGTVSTRDKNGTAVCQKCFNLYYVKKEICIKCDKLKKVSSRNKKGEPYCGVCNEKLFGPRKICFKCGHSKPVGAWINENSPVCKVCYGKYYSTKGECKFCFKIKKIRKEKEEEKDICQYCFGKRHPKPIVMKKCIKCGEEKKRLLKQHCKRCHRLVFGIKREKCILCPNVAEVSRRLRVGAVCGTCNERYFLIKKKCSVCNKVKRINENFEDGRSLCSSCNSLRKMEENPKFALECRLRTRLRDAFKTYSEGGKTAPSKEYGIDYQAIFEHIGPCPGNREDYHIDHIKPISLFDFDNPEQVRLAFAPENHQWLTKKENLQKGAKYSGD